MSCRLETKDDENHSNSNCDVTDDDELRECLSNGIWLVITTSRGADLGRVRLDDSVVG